jgi:hypothetical protein
LLQPTNKEIQTKITAMYAAEQLADSKPQKFMQHVKSSQKLQ